MARVFQRDHGRRRRQPLQRAQVVESHRLKAQRAAAPVLVGHRHVVHHARVAKGVAAPRDLGRERRVEADGARGWFAAVRRRSEHEANSVPVDRAIEFEQGALRRRPVRGARVDEQTK